MPTGMVSWKEVQAMLDACAPGWTYKESIEYYSIYWKAIPVFPGLTRGSHRQRGKGSAEIFSGNVRKLARHLGILECAKKQLPGCF